jgi:hypothetical protein
VKIKKTYGKKIMNPKQSSEKAAPPDTRALKSYTLPYRFGLDPEQDAWFTAFFIENHLDHITHPEQAATPEQVRFMVYTEEDERYCPCSKRMFEALMGRRKSRFMTGKYQEVLERVVQLIEAQIEDAHDRKFLEALIRIKYAHEIKDQIMIPSRLEKRLITIFLKRTQIEDPYMFEKALRNRRMYRALNSEAFRIAINQVDVDHLRQESQTLVGLRELADILELTRLIALSGQKSLWESDIAENYTEADYLNLFSRPIVGNGVQALLKFFEVVPGYRGSNGGRGKKILWLADEAGELLLDLAIIKYLTNLGHKIIIAFKEGPLFTKVDFSDVQADEILQRELEGVMLIKEKNLSKNELVAKMRSDYQIMAVSDGTRENLNLLLASPTFARIFKEVDGIISRGADQKRRFFDTPFQFTQDVYNITADRDGNAEIAYKPRHPAVIKFSLADLEKKALSIIEQMALAKKKGMTVIFYSGIIGSIPGKIKMAKKIMSVFIDHLKKISDMTFIINPSEFYESGMDADDLMYMWEIVQRSGYIDIWRFQSAEDIAQAFQRMNQRVPPEWIGKDATFSTGCTKEMNIAVDVQKAHPEMQIIGPAHQKFMRRNEYGIGKMYDKRLSEII